MRISTGYQFESYSQQIAANQARMFEMQRQVSSGKKFEEPSDDPVATYSLLSYRSLRAGMDQYQQNLHMSRGFLGFTEEALTEANTAMRRGYELAVSGASTAVDQNGRNAMADEVTALQKRLLDIANSRGPSGQYIFAGQATDAPPFSVVGTALVYSGDNNAINIEIGPAETMVVNTAAGTTFTEAYKRLEDLKNNLISGNIPLLADVDLPAMQASMDTLVQARGQIGSKLQTVEQMTDNYERRIEELTGSISDVEDVDISEAILKYKQAESAYAAALQVASAGFGLSLMDFIR